MKTVDVAVLLDEGPWTGYQKRLVLATALTIILDGFDNQVLGAAIPALMREWGVPRRGVRPDSDERDGRHDVRRGARWVHWRSTGPPGGAARERHLLWRADHPGFCRRQCAHARRAAVLRRSRAGRCDAKRCGALVRIRPAGGTGRSP